jgi:spore germination protein
VFYPDEVTVKVCEERGLVIGLDASKYLKNHRDRDELNVVLSLGQAQAKLHDKLNVEASRLVVFQHKGKEYTAYEFFCSYKDERYFVYVDANSGEELAIVNAKNIE